MAANWKIVDLDVLITVELKAAMLRFIDSITEFKPTICLMKGHWSGGTEASWYFGAYAPENIEAVGSELAHQGHPLLYCIGDMTVAIPQFDLVPELNGKSLSVGARGIEVENRDEA
jgi:hypothetical protein